jgi:hypothetical protein
MGGFRDFKMELRRSSDGSVVNLENYAPAAATLDTSDTCHVAQWQDGGGRSLWSNKSSLALSKIGGIALTSRYNTSVDINHCKGMDATAHALAFLTGTVTTTQRETITDLINAL